MLNINLRAQEYHSKIHGCFDIVSVLEAQHGIERR